MSGICDRLETLISAWMDGELERREATEMLDHLTRCASCRSFYRRARALEGVVRAQAPDRSADSAVAASELWARIEKESAPASKRHVGVWALRAAALAIVALALAFVLAPRAEVGTQMASAASESDEIEVELGSRRGQMTEDRFLEIATEVLQADRRYQRAMLQVMDRVIEDLPVTEGGGDVLAGEREGEREGENTRGRA